MAKKRKAGKPAASHESVRNSQSTVLDASSRWSGILLAALVALIVARTFVPEDGGGQQGHGAPFIVLWLLVAGAWLIAVSSRNRFEFRFAWPDVLVVALVGWHAIAAIVAIDVGQPRAAMNVLCDWVAMALTYLLARQVVQTRREARTVIVAMLGLTAGMSAVAIHQYFVTLPRDMAAFDAARHSVEQLFEQTGQWLPEDSSARQQFEARLASRLPTATYALSNSLAGFVVPWLVVLIGILPELKGRAVVVASLAIAAAFAVCIWLAGSRTAGLAALVGMALVAVDRIVGRDRASGWLRGGFLAAVVAGAGVIVVLLATPFGRVAVDAAWRSVAFRIEYWRATLAMIADYPLFGCGPGQFQDTYTAYKLVGAAEEIQDPHNWILEVWSTAGTPALLLLVLALIGIAIGAVRNRIDESGGDDIGSEADSTAPDSVMFGAVGGIMLGTALTWITGYPLARPHVILFVAAMVGAWFLWKRWAAGGPLPPRLPLIAAIALLVNLLAAGGIGYPAVADSLWLLLALQLNSAEGGTIALTGAAANRLRWCAGIALAAVSIVAIRYEYVPVMACRTRIAAADAALAEGRGMESRAAIEAAAAADPWSAPAAVRLADQRFADFEFLKTDAVRRGLDEADGRVRELAPRRSKAWAQSADYAAAIHRDTGRVEYRNAAERYYERAIELYPTSAEIRSRAAEFWASTDDERARKEAGEALRLDDAMRDAGHVDRTLRPALRSKMESLAQGS